MAGQMDKGGIQVIARAAAILRTLKDFPGGASLGQIAKEVDLPRSTVQRIAKALSDERLIISDASGRGLKLGPELSSLASAVKYDIIDHCRILLTDLSKKTNETTDLSVLRGSGMEFLDQIQGNFRLTTVSKVGEVFPLTTTSNGKACLAQLPERRATKLIENEWKRSGTDRDLSEFLKELAETRENGLAYNLEEHTKGISAIGFAFKDWHGDLHAISVPIPTTRYDEQKDIVEAALRETAVNIRQLFA